MPLKRETPQHKKHIFVNPNMSTKNTDEPPICVLGWGWGWGILPPLLPKKKEEMY